MSVRIVASFPGLAYMAPVFDRLQSAKTEGEIDILVSSPDPILSRGETVRWTKSNLLG